MKNSRFYDEQIIAILKQSEAGAKTSDLCRQHGIRSATFYAWRSKYGGLEVSEAKRPKQLEEENAKLKRIVAGQALDIAMLKDSARKNGEPTGQESGCRAYLWQAHAAGERRACGLIDQPRFGYRRLTVLLQRAWKKSVAWASASDHERTPAKGAAAKAKTAAGS